MNQLHFGDQKNYYREVTVCVTSNNIFEVLKVSNNKLAIRRSDIFMAKLTGDSDSNLLVGEHPVLILSCQKSNVSSTLINIIPLTSSIKGYPSNVVIGTESGLEHKSTILTNQIRTIPKKDLLFKMGYINTQQMDLVMETLQNQFGIKNDAIKIVHKQKLDCMFKSIKELIFFKTRYGIVDVELDTKITAKLSEVKTYCNSLNVQYGDWGKIEMFKIYEEKRNEVRLAGYKKDYELMAQLTEEYLKNLYELDYIILGADICGEFEWAYYNFALATKKIGHVNKAYDLAKQALNFTSGDKDSNYIYTCWLIGECCDALGEKYIAEGVAMFEECIEFYKKIGEKKYELLSEFNKAKILRDISCMQRCIKEYKSTKFKQMLHSFGDMRSDEVLEEMEVELKNIL